MTDDVEEAYRAKMHAIAKTLDGFLNDDKTGDDRDTGFVLLVYNLRDVARCNYISNGSDRRDIVILMKELIARFEGQPEITGNA